MTVLAIVFQRFAILSFFLPDCTGKPSSTTLDRSGDKDTKNLSCSWFSEKSFPYLTIEYVSSPVLLWKLSLLLQGRESTQEGRLWSEEMEGSTTQRTPLGDLAPHYPTGWPEQATLCPLILCLLPGTREQPHLPCSPCPEDQTGWLLWKHFIDSQGENNGLSVHCWQEQGRP